MKDKLIIYGIGNLAEMLHYYINKFNMADIKAFTADSKYLKAPTFLGLPVIDSKEIKDAFAPSEHQILAPLTPADMNEKRETKFLEVKNNGYRMANFIHPESSVDATILGENNIIFEQVTLLPFTIVGNNNVFWSNSCIGHHGRVGDNNWFSASTTIGGETIIENNCFFGIGSNVKNNLRISDKTFVGMGVSLNRSSCSNEVYLPTQVEPHKIKSDRLGNMI